MVKQIKKSKVHSITLLFLVSMCIVLLAGCTGKPDKTDNISLAPGIKEEQDISGSHGAEQVKKGFLFAYNEMEIAIDMAALPVLEALGEAQSYFEADSCAIDGKIRTYSYGSFELDTYEVDGIEYISCIYFKDDMISTKEGAYLFMTREQLFDIYGEAYTEEAGMLVYSKDGMKLKFIVTDGKVTSIQYASMVTEVKQ